MGVDFFPCAVCKEIINDCGYFCECCVCSDLCCLDCSASWKKVNLRETPNHVCEDCQTVSVDGDEVFAVLLRMYRALPGSDANVTAESIRDQLEHDGRLSAYARWKQRTGYTSDGEEEEEEEKEEDDEESESDDSSSSEPEKKEGDEKPAETKPAIVVVLPPEAEVFTNKRSLPEDSNADNEADAKCARVEHSLP